MAARFRLALLIGLPSGLMMGLKLPGVIFALGVCFGILFMGGSLRRLFLVSFAFGLGVLLGVAITLGYWAWHLQAQFGNPLFPYFNEFFKSPLAPPTSARDEQFLPHGLRDYLLFPFVFADSPYRVGEIPWRDWRIPILYALLPLAVVLRLVVRPQRSRKDAGDAACRALSAGGGDHFLFRMAADVLHLPLCRAAGNAGAAADRSGGRHVAVQIAGPRASLAACILLAVAVSVQPGNWTRARQLARPFRRGASSRRLPIMII